MNGQPLIVIAMLNLIQHSLRKLFAVELLTQNQSSCLGCAVRKVQEAMEGLLDNVFLDNLSRSEDGESLQWPDELSKMDVSSIVLTDEKIETEVAALYKRHGITEMPRSYKKHIIDSWAIVDYSIFTIEAIVRQWFGSGYTAAFQQISDDLAKSMKKEIRKFTESQLAKLTKDGDREFTWSITIDEESLCEPLFKDPFCIKASYFEKEENGQWFMGDDNLDKLFAEQNLHPM